MFITYSYNYQRKGVTEMSKSESKYGLFNHDSELLESFWEEGDKRALIKALGLAEFEFNARCEKGFVLARIDYLNTPFRVVADVKNYTAL